MGATYKAAGDRVDYTPGANVTAGDIIVQETMVGIATSDIASGVKGSLAVRGLFTVAKENSAFAAGADVYYDAEHDLAFAGAGVYLGKAAVAAAQNDATVDVILIQQEAAVSGTATGTGTGA